MTKHMFTSWHHLKQNSKSWLNEYVLDPYFFNLIRWIQLCDKKNLASRPEKRY